MPVARLNGVWLRYEVAGAGDLVVMVMGTGSPGRVWQLHQVPALVRAGYRVATFDSRGVTAGSQGDPRGGPEAGIEGLTIDDMVGDVAALVEHARLLRRLTSPGILARAGRLGAARPEWAPGHHRVVRVR